MFPETRVSSGYKQMNGNSNYTISPLEESTDAPLAHDRSLFERFYAGDDRAFLELFDRHTPKLHLYCVKLVADRATADDILQDAWERMIRMRSSGAALPDNPIGYLVRTVRNLALNRLRDQKHHAVIDDLSETDHPGVEDRELSRDEELVVAALPRLSESYREVLVLHAYAGYRFEEIAEMLGEPVGAIRTRAWRARAQLARVISASIELEEQRMNESLNRGADVERREEQP